LVDLDAANLEEVERIVPGGNYGWGVREGTFVNGNDLANGGNGDADDVFANNVPDALDVDFRGEEFLYPVVQYDHGEGQSIAGGFVYHGTLLPQLEGKFIFDDIVRGRIFAADVADMRNVDITSPLTTVSVEEIQLFTVNGSGVETDVELRTLVGGGRTDLRLGQRPDGEIYIMTKTDGWIRLLTAEPELPGDYDHDGLVDAADYTVWRDRLGQTSVTPYTGPDGDGDGQISAADYTVWKSHFGTAAGSGATASAGDPAEAVPEPAAIVILLTFCLLRPASRATTR